MHRTDAMIDLPVFLALITAEMAATDENLVTCSLCGEIQ